MREPASVWELASVFEERVVTLNLRGPGGFEAPEKFKDACGVEGVDVVVRMRRLLCSGGTDQNDGSLWLPVLEQSAKLGGGYVRDAGVQNDSVDAWEAIQGRDRFLSGVCRDDIELRGLDDKFACGDASCKFSVNHQKTGSSHALTIQEGRKRSGLQGGSPLIKLRFRVIGRSVGCPTVGGAAAAAIQPPFAYSGRTLGMSRPLGAGAMTVRSCCRLSWSLRRRK